MDRNQHILLSPTGVRMTSTGGPDAVWQCEWDEVREIVAWKVDAFTVDIICIGLRVSDEPEYLVIHEEAEGWKELNAALKYQFGIHPDNWFSQVAFPAFQENWTVLWTKALNAEAMKSSPPATARRP